MNQACFPQLHVIVQGKQTLSRLFQILTKVPKTLQVLGPGISLPFQASGQATCFPIFGSAEASVLLHVLIPLPGALFSILPLLCLSLLQVAPLLSLWRFPDQAWSLLNTFSCYFFPMELSTVVM